jgi:hypothetical protein
MQTRVNPRPTAQQATRKQQVMESTTSRRTIRQPSLANLSTGEL